MEETWADMDKESESNNDDHCVTPTPKEIVAKNASVIEAMKRMSKCSGTCMTPTIIRKRSMTIPRFNHGAFTYTFN